MKVIMQGLAHESLESLYEYLANYSTKNAIETTEAIYNRIENLKSFPYTGRYIPEIPNKRFRELIYRKTQHSVYRIIYYISEINQTIYVIYIFNSKQDFQGLLKLHNYFNNSFQF